MAKKISEIFKKFENPEDVRARLREADFAAMDKALQPTREKWAAEHKAIKEEWAKATDARQAEWEKESEVRWEKWDRENEARLDKKRAEHKMIIEESMSFRQKVVVGILAVVIYGGGFVLSVGITGLVIMTMLRYLGWY